MVTTVKGRPYFFLSSGFGCLVTRHLKLILSSLFLNSDDKEIGTTLDLCYHPYYPCLYSLSYSIPTFLSIFCKCFLYLFLSFFLYSSLYLDVHFMLIMLIYLLVVCLSRFDLRDQVA